MEYLTITLAPNNDVFSMIIRSIMHSFARGEDVKKDYELYGRKPMEIYSNIQQIVLSRDSIAQYFLSFLPLFSRLATVHQ
jgi:hypothetical protein